MKRIFVTLLAALSIVSMNGQTNDLLSFVESFDWSMSENKFKSVFSDRIAPETDSLVSFLEMEPHSYLLKDLKVGNYSFMTVVTFAEKDGPSIVAKLADEEINVSVPSLLALRLDREVSRKMQDPDMSLNNESLSSLGADLPSDVQGSAQIWMSEKLTFATFKAEKEGNFFYLIMAQKGEKIEEVDEDYNEPDFRKGKWGDSMAECKKKEGKPDEYYMEDIYAFDTYVAGLSVVAAYRFTEDRLTSGKYVFKSVNEYSCIKDYETIVSYLTKKYDKPLVDEKDYTASDYEKSVYSDGELVRMGKLKMRKMWGTPHSIIAITLYGEEFKVGMNIEYYSNKFEKMREESILNDL